MMFLECVLHYCLFYVSSCLFAVEPVLRHALSSSPSRATDRVFPFKIQSWRSGSRRGNQCSFSLSSTQFKQMVLLVNALPLAWSFIPIKPVSYQPEEALTSPHTTIDSNQAFTRVCEMCCVCELERERLREKRMINRES